MSRTITVSDDLYTRLEKAACKRGLASVEQLLEKIEELQVLANEGLARRREAVQRINELREQIFAANGLMPDSTELIREDRER
jgi:predicted CopG family antitoxin